MMDVEYDPDYPYWQPWTLGPFHPEDCGGHIYVLSSGQLTDSRRKGEKAYHSTGKWQVVHHHLQGENCHPACEAYGLKSEVPRRG